MSRVCMCLVLVLVCTATVRTANTNVTSVRQDDSPPVRSVLECVLAADWTCVQVKTLRALKLWLKMGTVVEESDEQQHQAGDREVESKEGDNEGDEEEHQEHEEDQDVAASQDDNEVGGGGGQIPGASLLDQLAEALVEGVSAIFLADTEEERRAMLKRGTRALDVASRQLVEGRKKGHGHGGLGGHKHHGVGELLSTIMMLKSGLMAIGTGFSALIQLKTFSIGLLGLIVSVARLFMQIKASKQQQPPPIVKIFQLTQTHEHELEPYPIPELATVQHHQHYEQFIPVSPQLPSYSAPEAHDRIFAAQRPAASAVRPVVVRAPSATASLRPAVAAAVITRKRQEPVHIMPSNQ